MEELRRKTGDLKIGSDGLLNLVHFCNTSQHFILHPMFCLFCKTGTTNSKTDCKIWEKRKSSEGDLLL